MIPAANTKFQRALGIHDSPQKFADEILASNKGQSDGGREKFRCFFFIFSIFFFWILKQQ